VRIDDSFAELYRTEFEAVYRAVFVMCGDPSVAEEATQEAFARALERWRRLADRPWVAGWVTTTAMNVARRTLRRRRPELPGRAETSDVDAADLDLWRGVRSLPRRQQEAVVLHHVLDLPVSDVARLLGCSEGAVKVHLSRGRASLRERLQEVPDE